MLELLQLLSGNSNTFKYKCYYSDRMKYANSESLINNEYQWIKPHPHLLSFNKKVVSND